MCPWAENQTPTSPHPEEAHWFLYNHYKTPSGLELIPLSAVAPWSANIQDAAEIQWRRLEASIVRGRKQIFEELSFLLPKKSLTKQRKRRSVPSQKNALGGFLICGKCFIQKTQVWGNQFLGGAYSHCPLWVCWWWSLPPWGDCWE